MNAAASSEETKQQNCRRRHKSEPIGSEPDYTGIRGPSSLLSLVKLFRPQTTYCQETHENKKRT